MAFSWGSTNNNNSNNNSSNGFSWGNNNNNNSSNNNNNSSNNNWSWGGQQGEQSNNNNNNNNNNNSGWGNNNNNNNNSWGNNNNNTNNNNGVINPNNDHVVNDIASDAISCVKFHPQNAQFIVSSWDNTISVYEFFGNNQSKKLGQQKHDKPILDCCYDHSGNNIFSAGCDNMIKIWNPQNNQFSNLGQHKAPIRCIKWCSSTNYLISGSWDRTISFWDPRSSTNNVNGEIKSVHSNNLNQKIYAMAQSGYYLVVALSNNDIKTFDLRNGSNEIFSTLSEQQKNNKSVCLKRQIRCIDIFPNNEGYVAASIGGRVIIKHFNRNSSSKDFSYKCHRHIVGNNKSITHVFAVNSIKFHQQTSVFATGGDDGEIVTWDKDGRAKLFTFKAMAIEGYRNNSGNNSSNVTYNKMPIVSMDYHNNGQYLLYSTSYNWNKGQEFHDHQQQKPQVYLHQVQNSECDKSKK